MRTAFLVTVLYLPPAWGVTLLSHDVQGNSVALRLSDGSAELEWVSPSTFRFRRSWSGEPIKGRHQSAASIPVAVEESESSLWLKTKELRVAIAKTGVMLRVWTAHEGLLLADTSEPRRAEDGISWEREAPAAVRYYGLGARDDPTINLRGRRIQALKPFLISTAGYAENHLAPGQYNFDMAARQSDRYRIEIRGGQSIDYYFYYGPAPKDIYEEHLLTAEPVADFDHPKWSLPQLLNASLSGMISSAFDLSAYGNVQTRLACYVETYMQEARERGLPFVRALPFQFPKDPEAARHSNELMLGDELLAVPAVGERTVYLPMGQWTNLNTNEVFSGRRSVTVRAAPGELPLFSRNGSIVPFGSDPIALEYFPKLPGEFFLFESDLGEYSQMHAAPAGDLMGLEIESKKARDYEWVVHHVERIQRAEFGEAELPEVRQSAALKPGTWFYDRSRKNLHVRVHASPQQDHIINLRWIERKHE